MDNTKQLAAVNQLSALPITAETITTPDFAERYGYLVALTKYLEDLKKNVDDSIKELVRDNYLATGENSMSSDGFRYTYVPATTRETFDSKALKAADPELYKQYTKVSSVSDSLKTFRIAPKAASTIEADVVVPST